MEHRRSQSRFKLSRALRSLLSSVRRTRSPDPSTLQNPILSSESLDISVDSSTRDTIHVSFGGAAANMNIYAQVYTDVILNSLHDRNVNIPTIPSMFTFTVVLSRKWATRQLAFTSTKHCLLFRTREGNKIYTTLPQLAAKSAQSQTNNPLMIMTSTQR